MKGISEVFVYLEKTFLVSSSFDNASFGGSRSFWEIGLHFLREHLSKMNLKDKITNGVLDLIRKERKNHSQENQEIIKRLTHIMLALDLYKGEFEERFY